MGHIEGISSSLMLHRTAGVGCGDIAFSSLSERALSFRLTLVNSSFFEPILRVYELAL